MIRIEGVPLPPPDPKLKRAAARFDGVRPAVTPALEAKAERVAVHEPAPVTPSVTITVTETPSEVLVTAPEVLVTPAKNKGGRQSKGNAMTPAEKQRAYRERRKASAP